jgi:hypothetical protein
VPPGGRRGNRHDRTFDCCDRATTRRAGRAAAAPTALDSREPKADQSRAADKQSDRAEPLRIAPRHRPHATTVIPAQTLVRAPRRTTSSPSAPRSVSARCAVAGETPYHAASSRIVGTSSPGPRVPASRADRRSSAIAQYGLGMPPTQPTSFFGRKASIDLADGPRCEHGPDGRCLRLEGLSHGAEGGLLAHS